MEASGPVSLFSLCNLPRRELQKRCKATGIIRSNLSNREMAQALFNLEMEGKTPSKFLKKKARIAMSAVDESCMQGETTGPGEQESPAPRAVKFSLVDEVTSSTGTGFQEDHSSELGSSHCSPEATTAKHPGCPTGCAEDLQAGVPPTESDFTDKGDAGVPEGLHSEQTHSEQEKLPSLQQEDRVVTPMVRRSVPFLSVETEGQVESKKSHPCNTLEVATLFGAGMDVANAAGDVDGSTDVSSGSKEPMSTRMNHPQSASTQPDDGLAAALHEGQLTVSCEQGQKKDCKSRGYSAESLILSNAADAVNSTVTDMPIVGKQEVQAAGSASPLMKMATPPGRNGEVSPAYSFPMGNSATFQATSCAATVDEHVPLLEEGSAPEVTEASLSEQVAFLHESSKLAIPTSSPSAAPPASQTTPSTCSSQDPTLPLNQDAAEVPSYRAAESVAPGPCVQQSPGHLASRQLQTFHKSSDENLQTGVRHRAEATDDAGTLITALMADSKKKDMAAKYGKFLSKRKPLKTSVLQNKQHMMEEKWKLMEKGGRQMREALILKKRMGEVNEPTSVQQSNPSIS